MTRIDRFRPVPSRVAAIVSLSLLGVLPVAGRADPASAPQPAKPRALVLQKVMLPTAPEPDGAIAGGAGLNPFTGTSVPPSPTSSDQTLTAPVTVNANSSADALTVTQSGGGRAINGAVNSTSNGLSAVKGITSGTGSGVNGVNSGTTGQAGKFEITNAASSQPSLLVTTTGNGAGVQAIIKGATRDASPAVLGQNTLTKNKGVGVWGEGGYIGLVGIGYYGMSGVSNDDGGVGVRGYSASTTSYGTGVLGDAAAGIGVEGHTSGGNAMEGVSASGNGVQGTSLSNGAGVYGKSDSFSSGSYGVWGESAHYAGVYGQSTGNAIGVFGYSEAGIGVVGQSNTGYAGVFHGSVLVDSTLYTKSVSYTSDRDQKQDFSPVDSSDVLTRIAEMPITAWDYKARPTERHIGPMAQDFHAAFGLGADEKHIDVVDGIGVSLAAIKELQRQGQQKDARIDSLGQQLAATRLTLDALHQTLDAERQTLDARLAALEQSAPVASAIARP